MKPLLAVVLVILMTATCTSAGPVTNMQGTTLATRTEQPARAPSSRPAVESGAVTPEASLPVPSATPGKIYCVNALCDREREVCCEDKRSTRGECVARDGFSGCPDDELRPKWCDEKADCDVDSVCCRDTGARVTRCERGGCASDPDHEVCLPGGSCSQDRECVAKQHWNDYGLCLARKNRTIDCGGTPCDKICCWNPNTKKTSCRETTCLVRGAPDSFFAQGFGCTAQSDCPTGLCSSVFVESQVKCRGLGVLDRHTGVVPCRTVSDCPTQKDAKPIGCTPRAPMPPWMKVCDYGLVR